MKENIAQRGIILDGVVNARDIGGYQTIDGKRVKWGMIYRSGELKELTKQGLECFNRMNLRTICDLRSNWEIEEMTKKFYLVKGILIFRW